MVNDDDDDENGKQNQSPHRFFSNIQCDYSQRLNCSGVLSKRYILEQETIIKRKNFD